MNDYLSQKKEKKKRLQGMVKSESDRVKRGKRTIGS